MNNIIRSAIGADYAVEHIDPGIRMGHNPVMLRGAKHLVSQRNRPFASLRACPEAKPNGVTVEGADFIIRIIL
jgi:hypothetical protein